MTEFPTKQISFDLPGLEIASLTEPTRSTGATLAYFPQGAWAAVDVRGGSVAASETTLLDNGSYSHQIDGVVFAGGSTMGLACGDGVREALFRERTAGGRAHFDAIPSVPTAVVYDYGGRLGESRDLRIYPGREMGLELMQHRSAHAFTAGRAGAGVSTTANKTGARVWGGQGLASRDLGFAKVVALVVLNPRGDLSFAGLRPIATPIASEIKPGTNTTLSLIVTDVRLDRSPLSRLAMTVHTSMARFIHPFHTFYDGDVHFAVSTAKRDLPAGDAFFELSLAASAAMAEAIEVAARVANS